MPHKHERRFNATPGRLRTGERIALLEVDRVVSLVMENLEAASVLDIGTGTGIFAQAFDAGGLAVTGIDANPAYLQEAKNYAPGAAFKAGTAEALPFNSNTFDLCFLGHVLHETDDPIDALREARRVSRLRVAVLEWPYREEQYGPPLNHRLSQDAIRSMAGQAGLGVVEHLHLAHMDLYRMREK